MLIRVIWTFLWQRNQQSLVTGSIYIHVLTPASRVETLPNSDRLGQVSALWDQRECPVRVLDKVSKRYMKGRIFLNGKPYCRTPS